MTAEPQAGFPWKGAGRSPASTSAQPIRLVADASVSPHSFFLCRGGRSWRFTDRSEFLENYCADCHDAETKKGGLNLDALGCSMLDQPANFDEWAKVYRRVSRGEMPPKKKTQPKPEEAQAFLASLGGELRTFDAARETERGRTVLRRLNRVEYENTVQDLLGIKTPLAAILPADTASHVFYTVADDLRLSMLQMEKYLEAADTALDAAINLGYSPVVTKVRWNAKEDKNIRKNLDTPAGELSNPKDPKSGHHVLMLELPDAVVFFDRGYPSAKMQHRAHIPRDCFSFASAPTATNAADIPCRCASIATTIGRSN